jgi:NAD(P)-dependent dehydrogenase (short-subunit alcohol dehydrogenase family)
MVIGGEDQLRSYVCIYIYMNRMSSRFRIPRRPQASLFTYRGRWCVWLTSLRRDEALGRFFGHLISKTGNRQIMKLQDKRVVIVGGTSGIGLAVARLALEEGATVVVLSARAEAVERAREELSALWPSRIIGQTLDVTDEDAIREFFSGIGGFDHLVYTAGEDMPLGKLVTTELSVARRRFDIRYWGAFMSVKYGAQSIREGGSIVLTSGFSATRPKARWTSQASIQSAVEGLTRALALELAPIRVNCVSPGLSRTPRWNAMPADVRQALYESEEARLPLHRLGTADEIGSAYLYLMENTYATGNVINVDGGGALV